MAGTRPPGVVQSDLKALSPWKILEGATGGPVGTDNYPCEDGFRLTFDIWKRAALMSRSSERHPPTLTSLGPVCLSQAVAEQGRGG
jgi:hypothetical protein